MKSLINILLPVALLVILAGCTKKKEIAQEAAVTIRFDHAVDDKALEAETPLTYTNAVGNRYNVTELSYNVSNIVLIDQGDNEVTLNDDFSINGIGGGQLSAITLPNGTYETIRFTVSSYLHKGKFLDDTNTEQNINIDFSSGGAENIEISVGGLTVNGVSKTAYILFNLNAVYDATTDFNDGATEAEVTPNLSSAFSFAGSYEDK